MGSKEVLDQSLENIEVQEVLRSGTDLREYAQQIDKDILETEKRSVADYLKETENITSLHNQIEECDEILERMENMLMNFQNDLGSISNEIISLQKRSVSMSVQLSNRQVLKGPLASFIEDIAVSEILIFGINNVPVTDKELMVQLAILNQKLNFVKEQDFKETKACHDVKDVLEKLKIKAIAKIRTYILEQIYKFRKPMANYQMPQNAMLKYKFFFEFILSNERNVAQEICNEYIDTLSKVYYSYFKSYSSRLDKLKYEEAPSKDDLMGIEESSKGGFFQKTSLKNRGTIFTIGNRGDVLAQQLEAPIIVPHSQQKIKYPYEALFRSVEYALVDNGCREYLFTTEFFHVKGNHAQELFDRILGKTLSLLVKNVENFVVECYDCLALFLCIQLIYRYRWMCHKRAVPALDNYWDSLYSVIWPRLEFTLKLNIQSVRDCDPAKLSNKELGPHYLQAAAIIFDQKKDRVTYTLIKIMGSKEVLDQSLENIEVQEVLRSGTDLREYAQQIDKDILEAEKRSVADYLKETENITSLHNQIEECDEILERMENMLMNFQNDLGSISNEIISLQKRSVSMSVQLSNRQVLKGPLASFIEDIAVSEILIFGINNVPVTDKEFMVQLAILNQKLNFVKEQDFKETKACHDVKDVLEKLKIKAIAKIRTYILEQIYKFRKPMANYQMPQNAMLKYKFFFEFVLSNERNVAQEICNEYIDTLSKVYYSYFKSYSSRLDKLKYEEAPSKDDLMGIEESSKGGFFQKTSLKNRGTIFSIGNRGDVLAQQLEAPIIVPHSQQKIKYPYEALFRSVEYALVDNGCREYLFTTEFFHVKGNHAQELFDRILGKTLSLLVKNVENFVVECYDCLALFLCIQLIYRYRWMCHKRAVPALDNYWDSLYSVIWPRLEFTLKLNIQSVRDCDPAKLSNKELGPHYITRRYAEFSAAVLSLSDQFPSEDLSNLLLALQDEVHCFLLKMAAEFPQRIQQLIFLINNYDMVLGVLMERTRDNTKEAESFRNQLQARSSEYVEELLSPHFGGIIQFVKEGEQLTEGNNVADLAKLEKKSISLVASFTAGWKQSLEEIHREVLVSFPNLVTGSSLLQMALTNFVQYYHKFVKLLTPTARTQLVNIHCIMVEIKKYKTNY